MRTLAQPSTNCVEWESLLGRLNRLSVTRHFDAYADIDWESESLRLDPTDPRCRLLGDEPLAVTAWYAEQPQDVQARLGCDLVASRMKTGLVFESVLQRGLLEYATTLPNGAPEFRYVYHEVVEEAQHSMMFQEFVDRSGFDAVGLPPLERFVSRWIPRLGRRFTELFFFFVLGGEEPIDHVQRRVLRSGQDLHPLVERITRIHVTEEARHLSFARHNLQRCVPALGRVRRLVLGAVVPVAMAMTARLMLRPSRQLIRRYRIPARVIRSAYTRNPAYHQQVARSLAKVHDLCAEVGLTARPWAWEWRALGLVVT